jgi:hypothetical protein
LAAAVTLQPKQTDWPNAVRPDPRVAADAQAWVWGRPPSPLPIAQNAEQPTPPRPPGPVPTNAQKWVEGSPPSGTEPFVIQYDFLPPPRRDNRVYAYSQFSEIGRPPLDFTPLSYRWDWPTPPRPDNRVATQAQTWLHGNPPAMFTPVPLYHPIWDWAYPARPYPRFDYNIRDTSPLIPASYNFTLSDVLTATDFYAFGGPAPISQLPPSFSWDWSVPIEGRTVQYMAYNPHTVEMLVVYQNQTFQILHNVNPAQAYLIRTASPFSESAVLSLVQQFA